MANESETIQEPNCTIKLERSVSGKTAFYVKTSESTTEDEVDKAIASAEYAYVKLEALFQVVGKPKEE